MIVIDCSILIANVLPDENNEIAEYVLDQLMLSQLQAIAPSIFHLEAQNTLLTALRRKRIDEKMWTEYSENLSTLPIDIDYGACDSHFSVSIAKIAKQHELTAYDAAYIELAIRKKLKIASLDKKLNQVAENLNLSFKPVTVH